MRIKNLAGFSLAALSFIHPAQAAEMAHNHGGGVFSMFRSETDMGYDTDGKPATSWDIRGRIGTDENKIWLRTEGERNHNKLENAEFWALYSRNIAMFWDAQAGLRYDAKPNSAAYLTLGFNGLAPYYFETEAHLFVSDKGDISARLREENDLLLTQQLILQPYAELNAYVQKVPEQYTGQGLGKLQLGLQTRYEFTRKFAPYVDVHYDRKYGETASIATRRGDTKDALVADIGLRLMF